MKIKKIDHVAVAVSSLSDSVEVFSKLFGEKPEIEHIESENVNTAIFEIGGTKLELVAPASGDSPLDKFLASKGDALHHLCLEVDDLASSIEELKSNGFEMISESPKSGAGGSKIVFIHPKTSAKILFELKSYSKDSDTNAV